MSEEDIFADRLSGHFPWPPTRLISTTTELPFVSVVVPMRDEVRHIGGCLGSLLRQDYPRDRLEIIVAEEDRKTSRGMATLPSELASPGPPR